METIVLSTLLWNINLRSGIAEDKKISDLILDNIRSYHPQIIILTEFVRVEKYKIFVNELKVNGFSVFLDPRDKPDTNQVLIAVKSNLIDESHVYVLPDSNDYPNFLHLVVSVNEVKINIIGARIKIGEYSKDQDILNQEYKDRQLQICKILDYLKDVDGPTIVAGDWNYGMFNENGSAEDFMEGSRQFYNFYQVRDSFKEHNFKIGIPKRSYSWESKDGNQCKLDCVFTRDMMGFLLPKYNWSFRKDNLYQDRVGIPDHAMLLGAIVI